jgi:DNA-nicking Smr family endonuclease
VRPPRGLTAEEAAAWARVAETVRPMVPPRHGEGDRAKRGGGDSPPDTASETSPPAPTPLRQSPSSRRPPPPRPGEATRSNDLDSHWDRRFRSGSIEPDFTLDLHGHTLGEAHDRLIDGIAQARAMGARVVVMIAATSRPVAAADRGSQRGAIRANVLDWLAASSHRPAIASIRKAHIRHGGEGALYVVLKRGR